LLNERRLNHGQAAGSEQRAADTFERARHDEHLDRWRECAQCRGKSKPHRAYDKHASPTEAIAERAAEQNQRREGERVAVDGPLQTVEAGVQVTAERRQSDGHDGGVQ